jgi:hypothetical protein
MLLANSRDAIRGAMARGMRMRVRWPSLHMRSDRVALGDDMATWDASWRPAQGDRVRSSRTGYRGTIVDVKFGGFLVAYDEPAPPDLLNPDWHRRDGLEPVGGTADRLRQEHELGSLGR